MQRTLSILTLLVSSTALTPTHSTVANALQSRLLSLPPEIRNRIWEYALDGGTLHVGFNYSRTLSESRTIQPYSVGVWICQAKISDHEAAATIRHGSHATEIAGHVSRHSACATYPQPADAFRQYSVALLGTCRQKHSEAALLPFKLNNFSFDGFDGRAMRIFVKRLMVVQQKSILRITLAPSFSMRYSHDPLKPLAGLQDATIFHEQPSREWAGSAVVPTNGLRNVVHMFRSAQLAHATVCIYSRKRTTIQGQRLPSMSDPVLYGPLYQEMEAKLLKQESGVDEAASKAGSV